VFQWTFSEFFEHLGDLDWLALIVSAIVLAVIGGLWYGPLFGKAWSKATGQSMSSGMPEISKVVQTIVYSFVFSGGLAYTGMIGDDIEHALVFGGLIVGLLIIGSVLYTATVWSGRNMTAWMIDVLFWMVAGSVSIYLQGAMA